MWLLCSFVILRKKAKFVTIEGFLFILMPFQASSIWDVVVGPKQILLSEVPYNHVIPYPKLAYNIFQVVL